MKDRIINGTRTAEQIVREHLEEKLKSKFNQNDQENQSSNFTSNPMNDNFSIEDLTDFYRINGVSYRNGIYQFDLGKTLLDNGAQRTQDQWAEYSRNAIKRDDFYVGDMPSNHSLSKSLFNNKDNLQYKDKIEEIRLFLEDSLKKYYLSTLTRIIYKKQGKDKVIHNYKLDDQYEVDEEIGGKPGGYITQINPQNELNAILGNSNVNEINNIYNWITGKNAYLWRINSKPNKDEERVARFGSGDVRFYLGCYGSPSDSGVAFAVRSQKIK